jgi:P-type E1-E2 ATPase
VVRKGEAVVLEWSQVQVGDVCYVESEEMFPADLILLASANEGSVAYIETASLDGEKNLKPRNAYPATSEFNTNQGFLAFRGGFEGDLPNKDLHKF